jgi:hypothetical protein
MLQHSKQHMHDSVQQLQTQSSQCSSRAVRQVLHSMPSQAHKPKQQRCSAHDRACHALAGLLCTASTDHEPSPCLV